LLRLSRVVCFLSRDFLRSRVRKLVRNNLGCQMVYFHTKIPNLGKSLRDLQWKKLVYLFYGLGILRIFGIIYGHWV
jgi:hypothetical protein